MPVHLLTDYLSIVVGFQLYLFLNKGSDIAGTERYLYIIGALLGALLGSRLLAFVADPSLLSSGLTLAVFFANKTIIGAILGGIIGIEIIKKFLGITRRTGDSVVVPLMVAIIIGRVGCQFAGVPDGTIGVPCDWAWCFMQGDAYPRHPLPLYEIGALLAALPFVYRALIKKVFPEGMLFRFFIIGYLGFRFFEEFLKNDLRVLWSLTAIQIACLVGAAFYLYDVHRQLSAIRRVITHGGVYDVRDRGR
ncbi:diacylglyceryl transferase [Candidatus Kaiserbacteria bacterium]|nr:diacylglyceryl transferase [Candidatus Kaiserbacteria bacterium]